MDTLEITLQHRRGDQWPVVAEHHRVGELPGRRDGQLLIQPAFADFNGFATRLTALLGDPRDYGACLGQALFQGSIRDGFIAARDAAGTDPVQILLVVEDPDLQPLRWERLCAPGSMDRWDFLALNQRTPFSRYLPGPTSRAFPGIGRRDLRALVVLADPPEDNPYHLAPFDAEATAAGIAEALEDIPHDVLSPLPSAIGPASLDAIAERITAGGYTLLHLVAHGALRTEKKEADSNRVADNRVSPAGQETVVYLLNGAGQVAPVTATDLIGRLDRLGGSRGLPYLVFLATCEGAAPEAETAVGGLAGRLVRELGVPAVVAMTDRVSIQTASDLARSFYTHLRATGAPGLALVEAGAALHGRSDILVPALFERLAGRPLFSDEVDGDRPLTPAEIAFGLDQLDRLLPRRAPILMEPFQAQARALRATQGTNPAALSEPARKEHAEALDALDALAQEVLDLSFTALALDQPVPAWDGRCPFPGLKAFQRDEQAFFFGREALVQALSRRLRGERLLAVLGTSGSGKSSLVLAGLVPVFPAAATVEAATPPGFDRAAPFPASPRAPGAVSPPIPDPIAAAGRSGDVRYLTPGADPESALARQLAEALPTERDTLLIVDQFEELFTLCTDPVRRQTFIDRLLLTWGDNPRLYLVFTLRADFWGDCAPYPALKDLMQAHQELIAPMKTAELRSAMEQQAAAVGLRFEADLSHRILAEVEGEPGAMPLLQHLLLELWRRRHGRWLRTSEYRELGGIKQAIAHTADGIYAELKDEPRAQGLLPTLFVRLTRLDDSEVDPDGRRDTRQRVPLLELTPAGADPVQVRTLVQGLADARLVVTTTNPDTGETQVEVSHEALIRHWPRLRGWLDEDRASWILLAAVREQARDWQAAGERETDLPRWGGRLQQAETLFAQERFAPTELEQRFVASAKELAERERAQRDKEQRERVEALERAAKAAQEKAEAQEQAATQARAKTRVAWAGASVALLLMLVAGGFGGWAMEQEREARIQTAQIFRNNAVAARDAEPLKAAHYYARAALTFHQAHRPEHAANAWLGLKFIVDRPLLQATLGHKKSVNGATFSADGNRILTWSEDGSARLWDAASGMPLTPRLEHNGPVSGAQFSRDEARILTWSEDGTARLWDATSGEPLAPPLEHERSVSGAQFSQDEARILTWSNDGTARLWNSANGTGLLPPLKHEGMVGGARFSRDELRILSWSDDGTARVWDSASGAAITPPLKHEKAVRGAEFSRDGSRILTWGGDNARLWDAASGAALTLEHKGPVRGAQFSRDEARVLTWGGDRWGGDSARLWDAASGEALTPPLEHKGSVSGAQFSQDAARILTWSEDGSARLWDADSGDALTPPLEHKGSVSGAQFSQDAARILTWSEDGSARLWDADSGAALTPPLEHKGPVSGAQFSQDEARILTWSGDSARLWDAASGAAQTPPLKHEGEVSGAQFSQDAAHILTLSRDGSARLWDAASGAALTPPIEHKGPFRGAQFSRDETRILTWGGDSAQLWDAASGASLTPPLQHGDSVSGAMFGQDAARVLTWGGDNARLWDAVSGAALTPPLEHKGPFRGAQFSRDETRILTWGGHSARLWGSASGASLTLPLEHKGPVRGALFSRDETRILTWGGDSAWLWDTASGEALTWWLLQRWVAIEGALFSRDETRILAWGGHSARLWDAASGAALTPPLKHEGEVSGALFSQDAALILTWGGHSARLWDTASGASLTLQHGDSVSGALFSQDATRILTRGGDSARLWDSASGAPLTPPLQHGDWVSGALFSQDAARILTWGGDSARLWDTASGAPLSPSLPHQSKEVPPIINQADTRLRTWTLDGGLRTWDLNVDTAWPIEKWPLRVEAETGTFLTPTGELKGLSAADWTRKRFCEYDAIRHDLKRLSEAEWEESQQICRTALAVTDSPSWRSVDQSARAPATE